MQRILIPQEGPCKDKIGTSICPKIDPWGIEKIEKECWSGLVDCLSLLQICYFYINNPLVMKAILFCDEPYFRYIHEEGGKLLQWAQRPSFPG